MGKSVIESFVCTESHGVETESPRSIGRCIGGGGGRHLANYRYAGVNRCERKLLDI